MLDFSRILRSIPYLLLACCSAATAAEGSSPETRPTSHRAAMPRAEAHGTATSPRLFVDISRIHAGRAPAPHQRQQEAVALRLWGEFCNFDRDAAPDGIAARVELVDAHAQPLPAGSGTVEFQLQYLRHLPLHVGLEIDPAARPVRWTQRAADAQSSQGGPLHLLPFRNPTASQRSGWALLSAKMDVPGHGTFTAECWICLRAAPTMPLSP